MKTNSPRSGMESRLHAGHQMQSRFLVVSVLLALAGPAVGQAYFVAPAGDDLNPGTLEKPFATIQRAQRARRQHHPCAQ